MKFKLAIENPSFSDGEDKSLSTSPSLPKIPLHAFLVYDKCVTSPSHDSNLRRTVSVPGMATDMVNCKVPSRRFSVCDLDNIHSKLTVSPPEIKRTEDVMSSGTNHHRRNSVALKFESPKSID